MKGYFRGDFYKASAFVTHILVIDIFHYQGAFKLAKSYRFQDLGQHGSGLLKKKKSSLMSKLLQVTMVCC